MKRFTLQITIAIAMVFYLAGCKNNDNPTTQTPSSFVELKVDPSFKFETFSNVETSIKVGINKASGVEIIQIYDGNPSKGGKLISTGSLDQNGEFVLPQRIASRLTEVYVGKLSSSGVNEFIAVPVTNNKISFDFTTAKSEESVNTWCDCEGANSLPNNFNSDLEINSGQTYCVAEGRNATIKKFKLHPGGTLNICGTATIQQMYGDNQGGSIIISPSGSALFPKDKLYHIVDNYGTLNISGSGTCQIEGSIHNYGEVNSSVKIIVQSTTLTTINDGTFTSNQDFEIVSAGSVINNCQFYITNSSSSKSPEDDNGAGFKQSGSFTNNGYMSVAGLAEFPGSSGKKTILGLGSLIDCGSFKIEGNVEGPATQGSQITATSDSQTSGGSNMSGYLDLWIKNGHNPNPYGGTKGPHVTLHAYTLTAPNCAANTAPTITSSLQIGGLRNQAIPPYTITASGTETITYNATGLPAGLTYNATTHVISGTVATVGEYNVTLTATNFMGADTKTLVIIIAEPPAPPVITSVLTGQATVNQSYNYTLTATGLGPITYNMTNLPAGLIFDPTTQLISGSPTSAGTYNINLFATNAAGTANETLVLTVGTPPTITSALTAEGTTGVQFNTYNFTATGTPDITYEMSNVPQGLEFDPQTRTINGTPTFYGVFDVLLTATNTYGSDIKTLVITINQGVQPPVITSSLTSNAVKNVPYSYTITADGSQPMDLAASNLPSGLTLSGDIISGIPLIAGTYHVILTATNIAGMDEKTLIITVAAGGGNDTDGDGIPDSIDQYPNDPDRAFNSFYPNEADFGSLAFEDLWPGYGDYDFNDFVVNFNYKIVTNGQNETVDVIAKFQIMADGASMNNGFGISFNAPSSSVESVTGCVRLGNASLMDPKGFELGHADKTVVIPFDAVNPIMDGGMANTIPDGKYIQTTVNTVTIHFSTPQASIGQPPFNPFIFVDQERGREVHLKDQAPTDLVNPDFFGTWSDASVPATGTYYRSTSGLPWAVEIPVSFAYPKELVDILVTHLKFADWAQSSGVDYTDWYMNNAGYRNEANIYVVPLP